MKRLLWWIGGGYQLMQGGAGEVWAVYQRGSTRVTEWHASQRGAIEEAWEKFGK